MPSALKEEKLSELKQILSERSNFVLTTYSGMDVEELSSLRTLVRESDSRVKIVKNRLFHLALKESGEHSSIADEIRDDLRGPVAVTFVGEKFPEAAKALVAFAKKNDKVKIKAGVMDGAFLSDSEVNAIATLPSREELLTIIARGLNTPATKIATGVNEIMASLARGIKAVGEKNGG